MQQQLSSSEMVKWMPKIPSLCYQSPAFHWLPHTCLLVSPCFSGYVTFLLSCCPISDPPSHDPLTSCTFQLWLPTSGPLPAPACPTRHFASSKEARDQETLLVWEQSFRCFRMLALPILLDFVPLDCSSGSWQTLWTSAVLALCLCQLPWCSIISATDYFLSLNLDSFFLSPFSSSNPHTCCQTTSI